MYPQLLDSLVTGTSAPRGSEPTTDPEVEAVLRIFSDEPSSTCTVYTPRVSTSTRTSRHFWMLLPL